MNIKNNKNGKKFHLDRHKRYKKFMLSKRFIKKSKRFLNIKNTPKTLKLKVKAKIKIKFKVK